MGIAPRALARLHDYDAYHTVRANKLTHYVGIPVIVFGLLGMLGQWVLVAWDGWPGRLDAGLALWLLTGLWYLRMDWRLGLGFVAVALGLYAAAIRVPTIWLAALFVGGWVLQFVGHLAYEKNRPAFAKNLEHLLVGPLWIFARLLGAYRPRAATT